MMIFEEPENTSKPEWTVGERILWDTKHRRWYENKYRYL